MGVRFMLNRVRISASQKRAETIRGSIGGFGPSGRAAVGVFAGVCLLLVSSSPALATNHLTRIEQLMVGANGDTDIQFLEMKFQSSSQNQWENVTRLTFHDAAGTQTGVFVIPNNPPSFTAADSQSIRECFDPAAIPAMAPHLSRVMHELFTQGRKNPP